MTSATETTTPPRTPLLDRPTAMKLAAREYERFAALLLWLEPADWGKPTDCPDWDVQAIAAHTLGMAKMAASIREGRRQMKAAGQLGGSFIDALTALQVQERRSLTPVELIAGMERIGPKAARARRRTPGLIRRRPMPMLQEVDGVAEPWTVGFLVDIVLTRDPWMHRVDIARATGKDIHLSADHDGVLVADVVAEWAGRHGQPYTLRLSGPAGGHWSAGAGGPTLDLDAVEFCRILSGRAPGNGLLGVQVPF
ncbi:MAG: maleylpyruvate isomerase family mycothiol-dependent enzyme [Nocardioidaceae bacterium]